VPVLVAAFAPRMMRLTARYADQWTTDWLGPISKVREDIAKVHAACEAEGRDPATLVITGGATVAYPDFGRLPAWMTSPDSYLTGDADGLAAQLVAYRDAGVGHVLTNLYPFAPEAIARYGEAVRRAKEMMAG
jgi:alkanesulfonate monooxygenase SsuD/methylene tetrahydromethanopterin reductase-like flavin-dependent oxidoreductase (luciferase family)